MSVEKSLETRVRAALGTAHDITDKRMFGGVCFMLRGNMLLAVSKDRLMCRLGKPGAEAALAKPHVRPMDFSGRAMAGYVYVDSGGTQCDADLATWIERCVAFVQPMPAKVKAPKPAKAAESAKATSAKAARAEPATQATAKPRRRKT